MKSFPEQIALWITIVSPIAMFIFAFFVLRLQRDMERLKTAILEGIKREYISRNEAGIEKVERDKDISELWERANHHSHKISCGNKECEVKINGVIIDGK